AKGLQLHHCLESGIERTLNFLQTLIREHGPRTTTRLAGVAVDRQQVGGCRCANAHVAALAIQYERISCDTVSRGLNLRKKRCLVNTKVQTLRICDASLDESDAGEIVYWRYKC